MPQRITRSYAMKHSESRRTKLPALMTLMPFALVALIGIFVLYAVYRAGV